MDICSKERATHEPNLLEKSVEDDKSFTKEIVHRGYLIKFLYLFPFPHGFKRFPEVKIIFILTILIHIYFFGLYNFISNITYMVGFNLRCDFNQYNRFTLSSVLYSLSWLLAPIPCYITDRYRSRHQVISDCFLLSLIGSILLIAMQSSRVALLDLSCDLIISTYVLSYILIALGSSGLLVIIIPYGIDQLEGADENTLSRFFYWYIWFNCVGEITIYGQYSYYHYPNPTLLESVNILGNTFLAVLALFFAILIYKISLYLGALNRVAPSGNPHKMIYLVLKNAYSTRRAADPAVKFYSDKTWIDYATTLMGGQFTYDEVNSVKSFFLIIPITSCLIWFYSLILQMPNDIFIAQGIQMAKIHTSALYPRLLANIGMGLVTLISIPLIQVPVINRYFRRFLRTILSRLFFGGLLVFIAYLISFIIEITRQYGCYHGAAKPLTYSLWAQLPQYILISLGKVLISANAFEFVYAQSPALMKGTLFGILSFMHGIGTLIPLLLYYVLTAVTKCSHFGSDLEIPLFNSTNTSNGIDHYCATCWYTVLGSDALGSCLHKCTNTHYGLLLILGVSLINMVLFSLVIHFYRKRKRNKIRHQMRFFNPANTHHIQ